MELGRGLAARRRRAYPLSWSLAGGIWGVGSQAPVTEAISRYLDLQSTQKDGLKSKMKGVWSIIFGPLEVQVGLGLL